MNISVPYTSEILHIGQHQLQILDISLDAFAATELNAIFFGQTAASRCEDLPTFRELTPSPSSGCAGGFFETKLMTSCPNLRYVCLSPAGCEVECDPSG